MSTFVFVIRVQHNHRMEWWQKTQDNVGLKSRTGKKTKEGSPYTDRQGQKTRIGAFIAKKRPSDKPHQQARAPCLVLSMKGNKVVDGHFFCGSLLVQPIHYLLCYLYPNDHHRGGGVLFFRLLGIGLANCNFGKEMKEKKRIQLDSIIVTPVQLSHPFSCSAKGSTSPTYHRQLLEEKCPQDPLSSRISQLRVYRHRVP